jgi:hypothetical protein
MKKLYFAISALFIAALSMTSVNANAQKQLPAKDLADGQIIFSYDDGTGGSFNYGTSKAESYDVAIHVVDPSLVGCTISGMRIPIKSATNLSGLSGWLSKALTLETVDGKKVNVPDIESQTATLADGWVDVTFATPYTITADGVYAGYSFTVDAVDDNSKYPVMIALVTNTEGFYMHSSRTYRKWTNMDEKGYGSSSLQLIVSGVKANSAGLAQIDEVNTSINTENTVTATIKNHGYKGVSSLEYTYELNGQTTTKQITLDTPIAAQYNLAGKFDITLPAIPEKGVYPLTVKLTKINGVANDAADATSVSNVNVYTKLPKHRALLEEYTGTWCGYCPRGFVGLEMMNKLYPNDFVGISYHNGDPMEITSDFPSNVPGFPDAWLDRVKETDAYCGDGDYSAHAFGIDKTWLEECKVMAAADLDVSAVWADDAMTAIDATATVTFPLASETCPYKVAFVLVADSLQGTGDSWLQHNYYSGQSWPGGYMDTFTNGGSTVEGLKFSDVLIQISNIRGIDGTVVAPIQENVPQVSTYRFDLSKAVNTSGESLIQNKGNLHVVAMLINSVTGAVVNANKTKNLVDPTGVKIVDTDANAPQTVTYYDLSGRKVSTPQHGVYLKSVKSGSVVKTSKVLFK